MLQPLLQKLGLNAKAISIYLTVVNQGKITPADAATLTGINRTTVYAVAKELIKKGLIEEEIGMRTYLIERPVKDLHSLVEEERAALKRKEHTITTLIAELENIDKNERYEVPRLIFVEEEDVLKHMYRQSERWTKSIVETDGIWHGYQDHSFVEDYEEWVDWYWHQAFSEQITLHLYTNDSVVEKRMHQKKYQRRQMKYWGEKNEISSTLWINGEYIIVIVTRTRPHYLYEIHDKFLAANLRQVFAQLWNNVK